ncbi:uncharacterized protein LOC114389839 [Glycine soja]|uniref:uncharacterized protein LOC114389839 n=1 Tax=Glycine soja TaxID=3848 RepID=UPI00103D4786|nr:uncharacterized protein LOC114389839 [Glycine soja]
MIIASWNIRDFNLPLKHHAMQNFLRCKEINVMDVLETKLNEASVEEIMRRKISDWHFTHNFASHNAGRILILWKQDKIHLSVLESNAQLIHCAIDCKTTAKRLQVSFIYGLHSIMARRSLWINLNSINANMNCPWLLIGDFNSILSPTDRFNGAEPNAYELQDFVDCYSDLGLGSINTHGPLYTWTNGRVWSKLDRALCNQAWFNSFGNSVCEVMEFISISDHTPLVVTTELVVPRGNSPFKFNNAIVDHPNFLRIVADVWKQNIHGCSMFKVCKKLKALKAPLKNLFKQEFSNISNRVELAEAEYNSVLNSLKQNPQDPSLLALANRTRGQTIMLRKAESMKFAQLIKNKYLLQADKCSKFFHALIKRNRHSRFIAAIRLEDGHNTSSQDEIALAFNYIEVPRAYHKQWAPHYPAYVQIQYNGAPHFIKVRKNGQQYYLADGLKDFRRNFNIHEGVLLLPIEAVDFVDASRPCMTVQHRSDVRDIWTISMHNGEQYVDDPWHRFLTDNDLMGGDEVVFYYRPNEHVWEIIFRKEPIWDEHDEST